MTDKSISTPSFHTETLRDAVASARSALEGYSAERDRMSKDIKALETYIQSTGLAEDFRFPFGKQFVPEDEQHVAASIEFGGGASGAIEEFALVWGNHKGMWRLLYESSRWDGRVDIDVPGGPYFWDEDTLVRESRPLIEEKLERRIEAFRRLPEFVRALGRRLQIAEKAEGEDEVPF